MVALAIGGCSVELEVVLFDGREWWACPVSGAGCVRVLVDFGPMGVDALARHVEIAHPHVLTAWRIAQRVGRTSAEAQAD